MQISLHGLSNNGHNGFEYPYKALSPVNNKSKLFESREDIYKELIMCYDEIIEKNIINVGQTLYEEHFFFSNTSELLDTKCQQRIKEYNFCKIFNTSPYQSLDQTPAEVIDDFIAIDNEFKNLKIKD